MTRNNDPIAVLDSGVGGISVLRCLLDIMPQEDYIYLGDSKNAPYGAKTADAVRELTFIHVREMLSRNAKAIVLACNTATSVSVRELRQTYPDLPIIGMEPALKPAVHCGQHPTVVVLATPLTLREEKFIRLMQEYAEDAYIIPMPCPGLVELIEQGITDGNELMAYLHQIRRRIPCDKIDAIVLGCTHFPHVDKAIIDAFGGQAEVFDGGMGAARETRRRLSELNMLTDRKQSGSVEIINTSDNQHMLDLSRYLLFK